MFLVKNEQEKTALALFFIQQSHAVSFCFKLKAKQVGRIVSMVSFKDRSKRSHEKARNSKIAERLKKGIARMKVWFVPN